MAICVLQDLSSSIEVLVFAKAYEKYSSKLIEDHIVMIDGRISIKEDMSRGQGEDEEGGAQLTASLIMSDLYEVEEKRFVSQAPVVKEKEENLDEKTLYINFHDRDGVHLNRCAEILTSNKGPSPVQFRFVDKKKQARFTLCDVKITPNLLSELRTLLGSDCLEVK